MIGGLWLFFAVVAVDFQPADKTGAAIPCALLFFLAGGDCPSMGAFLP